MKKFLLRISCFAFAFCIFSSCASAPTPERRVPRTDLNAVANSSQTEVYITRADNNKKERTGYIAIFLNGSLVAEVARGSVEKIIVPNGDHELFASYNSWSGSATPIKFTADGRRIDFRTGVYSNSFSLVQEGVRRITYVDRSAEQLLKNVHKGSKIAIIITSSASYTSEADNILSQLEVIWVNNGYTIIDRRQLDRIRQEQNFQLSGEVDDETAVSIGKFAGADIIVTGELDVFGSQYRLRLRALNTQTAQVVGASMERSP